MPGKYNAYKTAWDRNNTKQFKLKLNFNTDADIIERLEKVVNRQGYLKQLIRDDIAKNPEPDDMPE